MRSPRARLLALAAVTVGLIPLAACSSDPLAPQLVPTGGCPVQAGGPLTLVVGARQHSPVPNLFEPVPSLVREAAKTGAQIQVIRIDGAPSVALTASFASVGRNGAQKKQELDTFVETITKTVASLQPKTDEADVLTALTEGGRLTPAGGTVVLVDSGLQTKGQIRFQDPGAFGADPKEVVDYLTKNNLMPSLTNRSVMLVGLGNTADPQVALPPNLRRDVTTLWKTIAEKGGAACVNVVEQAEYRKAIATDKKVTMVPLPPPPVFPTCGVTVLTDDTVGFEPDLATFRDPDSAHKVLQNLASTIAGGRQLITLTGTTSSFGDSEAGRVELSLRRADAVKQELVAMNISADRITTVGGGSKSKFHINDRGPDGSLLPAEAARNRSVVVEVICP